MINTLECAPSVTSLRVLSERVPLSDGPKPRFESALSAPVESVLDGIASAGLLRGLQQMGQAAAILNQNGIVIGMNARGEDHMRRAVIIRAGRLSATSRDGDERLQRLIKDLLGPSHDHESIHTAVLPHSDAQSVLLRGTRIAIPGSDVFSRAKGLITFTEIRKTMIACTALLRVTFGLTVCEAGIALAIANGDDPRAIALQKNISIDTVRSHLKAIFGKTNTHRQVSLAVLVTQLYNHANPSGG